MKNYYSISIPKPCHEDWNTMTPKEKGRFCDSCSKTVIDFTNMRTHEIQDFIIKNKNNRICGHFKQTQLDSINLRIPSHVLSKKHSFNKLFLIALMIIMGTSLFSCTNKRGKKQKIDSVEVIDTLNKKAINIIELVPTINTDSISKKTAKTNPEETKIIEPQIDGEIIIETTGDIDVIENETLEVDSIKVIEPPEIEVVFGIIEIPKCPGSKKTPTDPYNFIEVETPPKFKSTNEELTNSELKTDFEKKIADFVSENFNIPQEDINLKGKQRVSTQFKIDSLGLVKDIRVRSPYKWLEKEAIRTLSLLPKLIPAKHNEKPVEMLYSLPIIFQVEE
ncbi:energy transducer TonB [Pontimicrobium sp. SW4]|uniref:Energy transducer TonB n=1 Tax=Pontimicrobium sp. SW4 TaxID=3153519 RepID=A0AAU7BRX4_9FLAO